MKPALRKLVVAAPLLFCLFGTALAAVDKPVAPPAKKPKPAAEAEAFFAAGPLPKFVIDVDPKLLKGLNDNPRTHVRAQIKESAPGQPDVSYKDVGIHLKGGPGSFRHVEDKPALNLNFDKFNKGQSFHGLDKILLNNSVQDPAYMWENLCGWIFRQAGGYAARASNCRVTLNGRDLGLFVIKEGFDTPFFEKLFKNHAGNLYEGSFTDIDRDMPIHFGVHRLPPADPTNKAAKKAYEAELAADRKAGNAKLKELLDACREPDAAKRQARLEKVLDVDKFLTFMACETIIGHWDGYGGNRNNYRIYHDPATDRLVFVAHGMDQVFQRNDYPLFGMNNAIVCQAVLQTPADKQRFIDRVAEIRKTVLAPDKILAEVDRISARILPLMESVSPDAVRQHAAMTQNVRQRIVERIANIDRQLAGPPKPVKFDTGGIAALAGAAWEVKVGESPALVDKVDESGKPRFRVKCQPNAPGIGSWRLPLLLEPGHYTFEARMKTAGVVTDPKGLTPAYSGAGIRVSGEKKPFRLSGDQAWQPVRYEFDVTDGSKETTLVCDLNAKAGQALFDIESLKLTRKK